MAALTIHIPDEIAFVENDLRRFIDAMIYKLRKNRHKGKWEDYTIEQAFDLLATEIEELKLAITSGNSMEVTLEGADVGNFGLIITSIALMRWRRQDVSKGN